MAYFLCSQWISYVCLSCGLPIVLQPSRQMVGKDEELHSFANRIPRHVPSSVPQPSSETERESPTPMGVKMASAFLSKIA